MVLRGRRSPPGPGGDRPARAAEAARTRRRATPATHRWRSCGPATSPVLGQLQVHHGQGRLSHPGRVRDHRPVILGTVAALAAAGVTVAVAVAVRAGRRSAAAAWMAPNIRHPRSRYKPSQPGRPRRTVAARRDPPSLAWDKRGRRRRRPRRTKGAEPMMSHSHALSGVLAGAAAGTWCPAPAGRPAGAVGGHHGRVRARTGPRPLRLDDGPRRRISHRDVRLDRAGHLPRPPARHPLPDRCRRVHRRRPPLCGVALSGL